MHATLSKHRQLCHKLKNNKRSLQEINLYSTGIITSWFRDPTIKSTLSLRGSTHRSQKTSNGHIEETLHRRMIMMYHV